MSDTKIDRMSDGISTQPNDDSNVLAGANWKVHRTEEEHDPSWSRTSDVYVDDPQLRAIAERHRSYYKPIPSATGNVRTKLNLGVEKDYPYYKYYFYQCEDGLWSIVGRDQRFREEVEIENLIKPKERDTMPRVERFHTDTDAWK
jgi:hypothetical protein